MRHPSWLSPALPTALIAGVLSGCSTRITPVYQSEQFGTTSSYSREFRAAPAATCEAARRALLSQGYMAGQAKADFVEGHKSFQPEDGLHVKITFHVVCASNSSGESATVFANALQDRYALKKTSNSASVGVGAFGSVSLPIGSSDDSLVKIASETISKAEFYDRFFGLLARFLVPNATTPAAPLSTVSDSPTTSDAVRDDH